MYTNIYKTLLAREKMPKTTTSEIKNYVKYKTHTKKVRYEKKIVGIFQGVWECSDWNDK